MSTARSQTAATGAATDDGPTGFARTRAGRDDGDVILWRELVAREPAAEITTDLPPELGGALSRLVEDARDELRLPGVMVGVVDAASSLRYWHRRGVAHCDPVRAPERDTVLRVGSISKTMTALGVLVLADDGRLQLDDPVNDHLACFRVEPASPLTSPVSIRQLLTHSSGLRPRSVDIGVPHGHEVPHLSTYYAEGLVAAEPPGDFSYSNDAFAVLGQLIEDVSATPFDGFMTKHVFAPLGMASTSYVRPASAELFTGYASELDEVAPVPFLEIIVQGAGSVFSTMDDMVRYAGTVLSGTLGISRLFEPQTCVRPPAGDPRISGVGLAWVRTEIDGHEVVWHNGGWPGATSELWAAPDSGWAVLAFTNTHVPAVSARMDRLARDALAVLLA